MSQSHLLYLHGFLSSPDSLKAQQTREYIAQHHPEITVHTPQLSGVPALAIREAEAALQSLPKPPIGIIGSSMGGFLAGLFAEQYQIKAALINPAVAPHKLFPDYLGQHTNPYTGDIFELKKEDIGPLGDVVLQHIVCPHLTQVYLGSADEVLDYRLAEELYQNSDVLITEGSDHAYPEFPEYLPRMLRFFLA